jgi:hypothetical protein
MKRTTTTDLITRADLRQSFTACHRIEDELWSQLTKRTIDEDTPAMVVLDALPKLTRPAWCDAEAWEAVSGSFAAWASAHGSLIVFQATRQRKGEPLQRWLEGRQKQLARTEEAKYLFADMATIGDEDL